MYRIFNYFFNLEENRRASFENFDLFSSIKSFINFTFSSSNSVTFLLLKTIYSDIHSIEASMEWISLYIVLSKRKVTEFEEEKVKLMKDFIEENKSKFSNEALLFSSKLKK